MSLLRLVTTDASGQGYDLSERISSLSWSNVNPGGDETCSFTLDQAWLRSSPEIERGNLVRVESGIDVVWSGRVEETARSSDDAESIDVTAYGLGSRLKDNAYREIYVDSELTRWQSMSYLRRAVWYLLGAGATREMSTEDDVTNGNPSILLDMSEAWPTSNVNEAWYDAGYGLTIGFVTYNWATKNATSAAGFSHSYIFSTVDYTTSVEESIAAATFDTGSGSVDTRNSASTDLAGVYRWFALKFRCTSSSLAQNTREMRFQGVRVYGDHGLSRGADGGFTASQIIADAVGRAPGVVARRIDGQTFELGHLVYFEPTLPEDVINDVNQYEACNWGTWGPLGPLESARDGYFQYTNQEGGVQHWIGRRELFDSVDLNSETGSLYDNVIVSFTDATGRPQIYQASTYVAELAENGLSPRTYELNGGTLDPDAAAALANVFLAIMAQGAPARGSATLTRRLFHKDRGRMEPQYIRADGSNLRIPDVLPTTTLFDLDTTPDKRTTFPIKRVNVSVGDTVEASLELDQNSEMLSVLQARLEDRAAAALR
jgi:hypothetical protein